MLIVLDESTHKEHLSQPLQTKHEYFKTALILLTGYNGIFNGTNKKFRTQCAKLTTDKDGYIHATVPQGAYELESLNKEIKRYLLKKDIF